MSENNNNEQELNAQEEQNKEVVDGTPSMSEAMSEVTEIEVGDTLTGEVLTIDEDKNVVMGLEGGQEGVIPPKELSATPFDDVSDIVTVGDEIEVVVIRDSADKEQGGFLLSKRRVDAQKVWDDLQEKYEAGEIIEAPVTRIVKGGLVVDTGVRGFIPASLVDVDYIEDFRSYEGKTLELEIVEIEPSENRLILSHKAIQEKELEAQKGETLENLAEGQVVTGKVARIVDFGAFIDLGGVDGLVHISEVAHEHVDNVEDYLTAGEEIEVEVLSVDVDEERISLSRKDIIPGPWEGIADKVSAGDVVDGTVKRLVDFGAFVEVFPGVEGLLHISQISHRHIATPHEVLEPGQEIQIEILDVQPEEERLSLSMKALEEPEEGQEAQERSESSSSYQRQAGRPAANKSRQRDEEEPGGFTLGDLLGDDQLAELGDLEDEE